MSDADNHSTSERRNFYGRIRGKTLRASQKTYLAEGLEPLSLAGVTREVNPGRTPLDVAAFAGGRPLWLEVGFGGGEHLVQMAGANRSRFLLGCEPFVNGIAMLLGKVRDGHLDNIAIYPGDVRDLFEVLPDAVVERAFLNYPDPWPKVRHHRRRFVTPGYLGGLARVMAPGGSFGWRPTFPIMFARRGKKCRVQGLIWYRMALCLGTTGFPPGTNKRRCARVGCLII